MIQRILITTAFFMLLLGAAAYAAETPATVQKKVTQSMEKEAKAQEQADNWVWDKQTAVDKIRDLKYRITWLQYRQQTAQREGEQWTFEFIIHKITLS